MNYAIQKISDLFDTLPESVKMVIYDGPLDNELADITNQYQISETDLEKIKGEILLVIIGANKQEPLKQKILQSTPLDEQSVDKIYDEIIKRIILPLAAEHTTEEHPNKETILNGIENPVPAKPTFQNPAGKNVVLDAQHNLPGQEKKILISSTSVPSRGPMLGGFRSPPASPAAQSNIQPIKPAQITNPPYSVDPYREPPE